MPDSALTSASLREKWRQNEDSRGENPPFSRGEPNGAQSQPQLPRCLSTPMWGPLCSAASPRPKLQDSPVSTNTHCQSSTQTATQLPFRSLLPRQAEEAAMHAWASAVNKSSLQVKPSQVKSSRDFSRQVKSAHRLDLTDSTFIRVRVVYAWRNVRGTTRTSILPERSSSEKCHVPRGTYDERLPPRS